MGFILKNMFQADFIKPHKQQVLKNKGLSYLGVRNSTIPWAKISENEGKASPGLSPYRTQDLGAVISAANHLLGQPS